MPTFLTPGILSFPTWMILLVQSLKQSPRICPVVHIIASLSQNGMSPIKTPLKFFFQPSSGFILKSTSWSSFLRDFHPVSVSFCFALPLGKDQRQSLLMGLWMWVGDWCWSVGWDRNQRGFWNRPVFHWLLLYPAPSCTIEGNVESLCPRHTIFLRDKTHLLRSAIQTPSCCLWFSEQRFDSFQNRVVFSSHDS